MRPADFRWERIIFAVDFSSLRECETAITEIGDQVSLLKIGIEALYGGWMHELWKFASDRGQGVFLDLKVSGTGDTIAQALQNLSKRAKTYNMSVPHAISVSSQVTDRALKMAVINSSGARIWVWGTPSDITDEECFTVFGRYRLETNLRIARRALRAGAHGIICSGNAIEYIKSNVRPDSFSIIAVSIRPNWATIKDDGQQNILAPREAIRNGADYLVVGRPISKAGDLGLTISEAAEKINAEIADA